MRRFVGFVVLVIVGLPSVQAANAEPTERRHNLPTLTFADAPVPVSLFCGGVRIDVVPTGPGTFAPAREVDGTRMFVPVYFGSAAASLVFPDGSLAVADWFGSETKGASMEHEDGLLRCGYTWSAAIWGASVTVFGAVAGTIPGS